MELNKCVDVHLDCGDFASFGLFPQDERLCVLQVRHSVTVKTTFSFLLFLVKFHLLCFFADVTSCRCFEILVHRAVVGGCSRTEVEDRRPSSYVLSQAVLDTPGVSL